MSENRRLLSQHNPDTRPTHARHTPDTRPTRARHTPDTRPTRPTRPPTRARHVVGISALIPRLCGPSCLVSRHFRQFWVHSVLSQMTMAVLCGFERFSASFEENGKKMIWFVEKQLILLCFADMQKPLGLGFPPPRPLDKLYPILRKSGQTDVRMQNLTQIIELNSFTLEELFVVNQRIVVWTTL